MLLLTSNLSMCFVRLFEGNDGRQLMSGLHLTLVVLTEHANLTTTDNYNDRINCISKARGRNYIYI